MTGQGKLLILTGAPDSSRLDWSTTALLTTFQPSIAQFALVPSSGGPLSTPKPKSTHHPDQAVWRSLPLHRTHIRTGFSQQHDLNLVGAFPSSADFLNTVAISLEAASQAGGLSQEEADEESSRLIADFYEHSLAVHGDLASSQLVPHPDSQQPPNPGSFTTNDETSFVSDTTTGNEDTTVLEDSTTFAADATLKAPLHPSRDHLSDLEDIAPATYLLKILPATMTVTLIVGVISIAAPREITTHYGAVKTLVEVLVGDETKSGFSVTFWLSGGEARDPNDNDAVLRTLRSQDIVLLQNVALNVFRKQVYGSSLRRGMTRVGLLYRARVLGEEDVGGHYDASDLSRVGRAREGVVHPQLEKTRRVRDWVLKFVGGGTGAGEKSGARRTRKGREREAARQWNQPPPLDSQ